jgi:CDP-diacylglycerol--serine O-phosphatidyltransferase
MELNSTAPEPPRGMRRVVIVVPSAFTLGNLFFGFWSIVSANHGNFLWAGWFIIFAGVLDTLDGRVARLSNTGTRFGAELDSLVDVISFGVAPALLMYFLEFSNAGKFGWVLCYVYVVAAAIRLARFNVLSAESGTHSSWFTGLPSPAAGMTLAAYFSFSQTTWYTQSLAYLNLQNFGLAFLVVVLGILMVSNVKYPKWPAAGFGSPAKFAGLAVYLVILVCTITIPAYFLFPLGLTYMVYGLLRAFMRSFIDRSAGRDDTDQPPIALARQGRTGRRQENE